MSLPHQDIFRSRNFVDNEHMIVYQPGGQGRSVLSHNIIFNPPFPPPPPAVQTILVIGQHYLIIRAEEMAGIDKV